MDRPRCPRHPDWKVWRDGTYGKPGQRRQRYKCVAPDGSMHIFTEWLSDQGVSRAPDADRKSARPGVTARNYAFTTHEIGGALIRVGRGESYRSVAARVRQQAGRVGSERGSARTAGHPQLIEDWVEAFAPVVFAHYAPERWPAMVQFLEFPLSIDDTGARSPSESSAFQVLGAVGHRDRRPYLYLLRAYPAIAQASREDLLDALPGTPRLVAAQDWEPVAVLERRMRALKRSLQRRGRQLRNRERTNRLLMLVQLQANGHASQAGYAGVIEEWLAARDGYAPRRRRIADPRGKPAV